MRAQPVAWIPKPGDLTVTSAAGAVFEEVEFDDNAWGDYDAENELAVSINDLQSTIEVA